MSAGRYLTMGVTLAIGLASGALADDRLPAPSFWDPNLHLERPDLSALRAIRFLTDDDYPPLDFALSDGSLVGFNVEIARAICEELHIGCTIQARRWDTLIDSLETGKGDAVIASISITAATRAQIDFTSPITRRRRVSRPARIRRSPTRRRRASPARRSRHRRLRPPVVPRHLLSRRDRQALSQLPGASRGAEQGRGRRRLRRRPDAGGLAGGPGVGRLLHIQGRPLHREPLFRRRRRHRGAQGGRRPPPRNGLGARPPRRQGNLRRDLHQVFPGRVLLTAAEARAAEPPAIGVSHRRRT